MAISGNVFTRKATGVRLTGTLGQGVYIILLEMLVFSGIFYLLSEAVAQRCSVKNTGAGVFLSSL